MEQEQLYIKVEDSPFDRDDLSEWNIPIYNFSDGEYIKINVCDYVGDFSNMSIIDIELTEAKENKEEGEFNGIGTTAKKDFYPIYTELIKKKEEEKGCSGCGLPLDECGWSNCGENIEDI